MNGFGGWGGEGGWHNMAQGYGMTNTNQYQYNQSTGASQQYRYGYPYRPQNPYGYPPLQLPWQMPGYQMAMPPPGPQNMFEQWGVNQSGMNQPSMNGRMGAIREGGNQGGSTSGGGGVMNGLVGQMGQSGQSERRRNENVNKALNLDGNGCERSVNVHGHDSGNVNDADTVNSSVHTTVSEHISPETSSRITERNVTFAEDNLSVAVDRDNIDGDSEGEGGRREGRKEDKREGNDSQDRGGKERTDERTEPSNTGAQTGTGPVTESVSTTPTAQAEQSHSQHSQPSQSSQASLASQPVTQDSTRPSLQPSTRPTEETTAQAINSTSHEQETASLASNSAAQVLEEESKQEGKVDCGAEGKKVEDEQSSHSQSHYFQPTLLDCVRDEGGRGRRESRGGSARLSMGGRGDGRSNNSKIATLRGEGKGAGGGVGKGQKKEGSTGGSGGRQTRSAKK